MLIFIKKEPNTKQKTMTNRIK